MSIHQLSLANLDLSNTESHCDTVHINVPLETARIVLAVILLQDAASKKQPQCSLSPAPSCQVLEHPQRVWGQLEPLLQVFQCLPSTQWADGCWLWCVRGCGAEAGRANLASSLLEGFKQNINMPQWSDAASSDICENSTQCPGLRGGGIRTGFSQTETW